MARDPSGSSLICGRRAGSFASSTTNSCRASACAAASSARVSRYWRATAISPFRAALRNPSTVPRGVSRASGSAAGALFAGVAAGGCAGAAGGCAAAPVTETATTHAPTRLHPRQPIVPPSTDRTAGPRMLRTMCRCPARPTFRGQPAAPGMPEVIRYAGRTSSAVTAPRGCRARTSHPAGPERRERAIRVWQPACTALVCRHRRDLIGGSG